MKRIILSVFLFAAINVSGQDKVANVKKINGEILAYLNGKSFYTLTNESCSETSDGGGFMSYGHCVLTFSHNKVFIRQYQTRNRNYDINEQGPSKQYSFKIKGSVIAVPGLDYLPLLIQSPGLHGQTPFSIYTPREYFKPDGERIYFSAINSK
jgi:hypothetical protein